MSTLTELAPHEMLQLHEIIISEVTCTKKLRASLAMVTDPDLQSFMESSIQLKKDTLNKYQDFYSSRVQQE